MRWARAAEEVDDSEERQTPSVTEEKRRTSRRDNCDPSFRWVQATRARASIRQIHNDSALVQLLDVLLNLCEKGLVLLFPPHLRGPCVGLILHDSI